jgi:hypothetical protein
MQVNYTMVSVGHGLPNVVATVTGPEGWDIFEAWMPGAYLTACPTGQIPPPEVLAGGRLRPAKWHKVTEGRRLHPCAGEIQIRSSHLAVTYTEEPVGAPRSTFQELAAHFSR